MANGKTYPQCLFWVDIETTKLPVRGDFSDVEVLEVAVIVTDFDHKPYFGYQGVVGMNEDIKASLRTADEVVLKMHLENGLLKDSKESTDTLQSIEADIIGMLKDKTTFEKGEFMIAGSGVARFDFALLEDKMPELASYLYYAPYDIGVLRRVAYYSSGRRDVVPTTRESFQEGFKAHRALDDVKAHIKEANVWKKFFRDSLDEQTKA